MVDFKAQTRFWAGPFLTVDKVPPDGGNVTDAPQSFAQGCPLSLQS